MSALALLHYSGTALGPAPLAAEDDASPLLRALRQREPVGSAPLVRSS